MQPYAHVAPQVGQDVLIAEQIHHQNQIHNNAIRVFLTSRKYARSLTKSNIKVPIHQKPTDLPYDASDKCLQITMSRILKANEITEKSKERLQKMQDRMNQQIESNNTLMQNLKKDKKWIKIKHQHKQHSSSHSRSSYSSHSHSNRRSSSGNSHHHHRYKSGRHHRSGKNLSHNSHGTKQNDRRIQTVNRNKNSRNVVNMNSTNNNNNDNNSNSNSNSGNDNMSGDTTHNNSVNVSSVNNKTNNDNSGYYINGRRIHRHRSSVISESTNIDVLNQLKATNGNKIGNGSSNKDKDKDNNGSKSRFGNFGSKS